MPAQSQPVKPTTCARQAEGRGAGPCFPALGVTLALLLLSACGSAPPAPPPTPTSRPIPIPAETDLGALVAREAAQLIGMPYRYGGDDLRGFDCSGLVFYTHDK